MRFNDIKRINLENWPTPLHPLKRYGQKIGHNCLYIKRDDISLTGLGGNKLRKLEYWLAEAKKREADMIVVAGGCQSNLVRLTAAASAKVGFDCLAIHNGLEPKVFKGNLLLTKLFGAKQIFIGNVSEKKRDLYVKNKIESLSQEGLKTYCVNNQEIGSLGYIDCLLEMNKQMPSLQNLVIVGAMGITASGFIYANKMLNNKFKIYVISVEYKKDKLIKILSKKISYISKRLDDNIKEVNEMTLRNIFNTKIFDQWMGQGWGLTTKDSLDAIADLAKLEGIVIDHIYNAKTFAGLRGLIEKKIINKNEPTCIVHTGGAPAIFGHLDIYNNLLDNS
ncbi:MAG: 1-aminocyclopropane-1-carboxylate deaminase/D-cysteine desulfhydrase [Clostridia bacterium]